jgi:hypothetical protein
LETWGAGKGGVRWGDGPGRWEEESPPLSPVSFPWQCSGGAARPRPGLRLAGWYDATYHTFHAAAHLSSRPDSPPGRPGPQRLRLRRVGPNPVQRPSPRSNRSSSRVTRTGKLSRQAMCRLRPSETELRPPLHRQIMTPASESRPGASESMFITGGPEQVLLLVPSLPAPGPNIHSDRAGCIRPDRMLPRAQAAFPGWI